MGSCSHLMRLSDHLPMYLSAADSTLMQNTKSCVNVFSEGSPSRILIVRLISFGITTRPRSSILLTIPVAFILCLLFMVSLFWDCFAFSKLPVLFAHQREFMHEADFGCLHCLSAKYTNLRQRFFRSRLFRISMNLRILEKKS